MIGVVTGVLTVSAGLMGLMVFFMISSSVSPAKLWPMLGSLFTMLCVSDVDVDGRLLRDDCAVREVGKSNVPNDEFNDDATDVEPGTAGPPADNAAIDPSDDDDDNVDSDEGVPGMSGANADGFDRLFSNNSLLP